MSPHDFTDKMRQKVIDIAFDAVNAMRTDRPEDVLRVLEDLRDEVGSLLAQARSVPLDAGPT